MCLYFGSDLEDWDDYETPHWWAVSEYADTNPDDPDCPRYGKIWEIQGDLPQIWKGHHGLVSIPLQETSRRL